MFLVDWAVKMRIGRVEFETSIYDAKEHCDVLSMQIDSDLVIYRTTLLRTFQVVTICRVDKSEVLVVLISPHDLKQLDSRLPSSPHTPPPPPKCAAAAAATCRRKIVSGQLDEENPSMQILSGLLVQADEGVLNPVVDLIEDIYHRLP
ncbi:hypothetical protein F511_39816 [Dorcoceras hygrometricum]|uniref:Uncharacterized protein n=1 Tax=Dorcoceras hygrometricum TaxID=472368 RepID=A0A2Z7D6J5_9LAMI|nr:hypothetical protein F511_39816 [Dorcoceras hygrometricum]